MGDAISITAKANDPDGTVSHLDFYQGIVHIGQASSAPGTISWTPSAAGTYAVTAVVTDNDGALTASNSITITVAAGLTTQTLDCGQTVTGALATNDGASTALPDGHHYADHYTFNATAGETVILSQSSTTFDGYLALFDANGTLVAYNDDSLNQTSNSQIIYTISTAGTYTVEVTSYPPSQTGPYTLSLRCSASGAVGQLAVSVDGVNIANNGLLDFGSTPQGIPVTKTVTLSNTGNADLAIMSRNGSGDWTAGSLGQNVISPGQSTTLPLRFNATNPGGASGTVILGNTTAVNPYTINMTGSVTSGPTASVLAFSVNPASVMSGTSTTATVTLSGAAPNGGQLIGLSSANATLVPLPASVIVPTGQTTYSFTVPNTAISFTSTVTLTAYIGTHAAPNSFAQTHLTLTPAGDPPTVTLDTPTNNNTYSSGTIAFSATAAAQTVGASIAKVEFFSGTSKIGEDTSTPYTFNWTNVGAGDYTLHAVATDSNGLTGRSADVLIHVSNLPALATPTITPNGGTFTGSVSVTIADTETGATIFYTLDGTDPDTTSPRYTAAFVLPASATPIVVTARAFKSGYAPSASATATFTINPVSGLTRPTVSIASPGDGSEITAPTAVVGSVTSAALAYWKLEYQSIGDSNWVPFAQGTNTVNNAAIGKLDTTLMLDGQYDIRLTAVDQAGQSADPAIITIVVKGHQKVGYFTVSFTDMTIPLAGIPITITRTYDSRDKSNGDFGVGWTLSTTNAKVQKRQVSGYNWNQVRQGGGFSQAYYLQPVRPHLVTITLPGDTVYSFQETVSPYGQAFYPLDGTTVIYQQVSGPKATLNPVGADPNVFVGAPSFDDDPNASSAAVELYDGSNPDQIYNPTEFVLTMHNGTKFDVSQANGLQTITDRNGNVITFSYNGNGGCTSIDSQDGRSIVINRSGANGAISSIKDLNDNLAHYSTDGFGNLANYTDRVGNTTTFDYDYQHNLIGIKNPIGIMPIRNYYYPDGRLNYTLDAQGHEIDQYYDPSIEAGGRVPPVGSPIRTVPGNAQITTDALGNLTLFSYDSYGNVTQRTQYLTDSTHDNTPLTWLCVYNTGDSYNPDRPIQDVDPLGNVTDFTYDTLGDILSTTRYLVSSDGTKIKVITSATYDAQGQVLTQTDALGTVITTNTYNLDGNLDTTKDALGNTTKFSYNSDGSLKRTIDPLGNSSTFSYDQNSPPGNITSVTDANGHVTNFIYDANNNKIARITTRTSAAGDTETVAWRWLFDESDRLIQTIYPDGTTCRTYYNALGKVDHTIDAAGRITTNTYDDEARLIKTRLPDGTFIATVYDADSRGYITTDRASRGTQSVYDTIGRVIATYPLDQNGNRLPDGNGSYIHSKGLCRVSYQKSYFG